MAAKHPLAEGFGFAATDMSAAANRHRTKRLCPFNNKVPNCTKDKAQDPLGVCSVFDDGEVVITCPIRFRQGWQIADDAADFFFAPDATWTTLTEVRLKDAEADGFGGATMRRGEGNYPTDFLTLQELEFATEFDAVRAAENLYRSITA